MSGGAGASDRDREAFERDLIARALEHENLSPDPSPLGKIVERVVIVSYPIVEAGDPWPDFLNLFHVTTREHIIRQELLFSEGERYDALRVEESARNLRAFPLTFTTVRIVTARGSTPDHTVVVVVTKDLWSIRLNSRFSFGGGIFNYLQLMPTEQNFLGFNQQLSLYTFVDRDTYRIGEVYNVPRLLGTRLSIEEALAIKMNYHTGKQEGGLGEVILSQPLFSLASEWGFALTGAFDLGVDRDYQGADLRQVTVTDGQQNWLLPRMWQHQLVLARLTGVHSLGLHWKSDFQLGYELSSTVYQIAPGFPQVPDAVRQAFETQMPRNEQGGWLLLSYHFYEADYHRFLNIQTYGLSEDFRFGPEATLEVDWAHQPLGFGQSSVRMKLDLGWMFLFGQDILSLQAHLGVRYSPDHAWNGYATDWVDRFLDLEAENVSPSLWGLGRLFVRVHYLYSQYNLDQTTYPLGGDNTLRGFITGFRAGPRLFNVNVEFRTRPLIIRTLHWGLVVFYDGGDSFGFTRDNDFSYHQSVGFGIRGLFPQFDRGVVRLDIGIPLGGDFHLDGFPIQWFTLTYTQAF